MRRTWGLLTLAVATLAAAAVLAAAGEQLVTGTASYRERIALPPGAVFEAVLEDVTDGDAPVVELGRATIEDPGAPPFEFEIAYDPTAVDPSHAYSVRTQISVGRRLMFVSEAAHPVLTAGAGSWVESWMIKVGDTGEEGRDAPVQIGAHGLRLPASFRGELPCADCDGIDYRLNLWPDQVFHLRRVWMGKDKRADTIGRWSVHPDPRALVLTGGDEVPQFQILGPDRLRPLGAGGAAVGDGAHDLAAADEFEEFEPHLPLRGMLTWVGDAARFTECRTGRDYPLVPEGDYAALEHAYLAAGAESGGPIMASFDGGIVREPGPSGEEPAVLVERFVGVWPGETCERAGGAASLTNTYWKILRLGETEVGAAEGPREPNLILRAGAPQFTATVGCNQLMGSFELDGDRLKFGPAGRTMMACPAPLDGWEKRLGAVLAATAGWRIDGQTLELLDAAEEPLALFQAVYLY
jgi:uncharacterized lipoprotein YbaY/heat shock protein HslJ/uncharacterized lipoprotein NlpE involved in copper resistance